MAEKKKSATKAAKPVSNEVYYQQGDVLLFKIDELPSKLTPHHEPVVAYGEVTGHSHKLKGKAIVLKSKPKKGEEEETYVDVQEDSTIEHEEHKPIKIPKGKYKSKIVRERNHLLSRTEYVRD